MRFAKLFTIILFVVALSTTLMADPVLSVLPPSANVALGETFSVDVAISGVTDLFAFQFDLGFDPSVLKADGVTEGPFLAAGGSTVFVPGTIDNIGGVVSNNADVLLTAISGLNGSGTLASFEFTSVGSGSSSLEVFNTILLDSSLTGISSTIEDGSVEVSGVPETNTFWFLSGGLLLLVCLRRRALAWLVLLLAPLICMGQAFDTTPPTLVSFSFAPSAVNVTAGPQTVTATVHATDNLSGFFSGHAYINVGFTSPSGRQSQFANNNVTTLPGSTPLDVTYQAVVTIPEFSESGNWTATVQMNDADGNLATLNSSMLASMLFPSILPVTSIPDTTPPTLTGLTITPSTIDVSSGPQSVTLAMNLADSQSGAAFACQPFCSAAFTFGGPGPLGNQMLREFPYNVHLTSGTVNSGVWTASVTFPQGAAAGDWFLGINLLDAVGNSTYFNTQQIQNLGFPATVHVNSTPSDSSPPILTNFTISPLALDTSTGPQNVNLGFTLTDNLSGVDFTAGSLALTPDSSFNPSYYGYTNYLGQQFGVANPYFEIFGANGAPLTSPNFNVSVVVFQSPSGQQNLIVNPYHNSFILNSGTPLNGQWQVSATLPQFSEGGTWTLQALTIQDRALNPLFFDNAALQALGFPTSFVVFEPSLASDGTVGPTGGTVSDTVFGSRASLTFPRGEVSSSTTVAIDVLSSPLAVPSPAGFSVNPASFFTNIQLVPEPSFPLPAPGLTLTLPLVSQLPAGTALSLYRLDPNTGLPIPAQNVNGGNIQGTVDVSGLSATFDGISRLSTAVAYIRTPGTVVGDVNGDGKVNCEDIAIIKADFGEKRGQPGYNARADMNNDGVISILDLAIVSRLLPVGMTCP